MRVNLTLCIALLAAMATIGHGQDRIRHVHMHPAQQGNPGQKADEPSRAPLPQSAPGQYVTPPPTGSMMGGSNSVGIRGFALHFPPLSLKLPSLQLPSFFKVRENPRMLTEPASAPYIEQSPVSQTMGAMLMNSPVQSSPQAAPRPQSAPKTPYQQPMQRGHYQKARNESEYLEVMRKKLDLQERHFTALERQIAAMQTAMEKIASHTASSRRQAEFKRTTVLMPVAPTHLQPVAQQQPRPAALMAPVVESARIVRLPPAPNPLR